MKKVLPFLLSVASAAVIASCTVNEIESPSDAQTVKQELTFEASLSESGVSPAAETKTGATLNDDGSFASIFWNPNDQINIFFTAGTSVTSGCFTNKAETNATSASFSGVIDVFTGTIENLVDDQMFWAVYPYSENNTCNGSAVTFSIPAEQSSPAGSFAKGQWPSMARSNGFNLAFYAVCSGIKFKVLGEGVTSVTFKNRDGEPINGTVTAGWDSTNRPEMTGIEGGTNQITVTPQGSSTFQVGEIYFVVVPVVTMSQGLEVTYTTARSSCTFVTESSLAFSRNKFKTLYNADTAYESVAGFTRVDTVPAEGGSYIVVNNGMALRDNGGALDKVDVSAALSSDGSTLYANGINVSDIESLIWDWQNSDLYTSYGAYTVMNGSDYLYVGGSYGNYSLNLGTYGEAKYAVWNYSDRRVVNGGGSTKRYLSCSDAWYVPTSSDTAGDVYLYKYEDLRSEQTISFADAAPQIDLASVRTYKQTVTGNQTDVTYEIASANPADAATIDPATGEVTALSKGTVTVKATAAGSGSYKPAEASYTLSITDSAHKEIYYQKVTDGKIIDGTYLIVYESANYAFSAASTNYRIAVEPANNKILATEELMIAEVDITANSNKYFLKTSKGYLYCNNNALGFGETQSSNYLNSSTASNGYFKFQNGTNNYYLRYSASNNAFQYGSYSSANELALYMLDPSAKAPRHLQFENASVTKFTGDPNFTNALSGTTTGVTFSSSNTEVATVNPATGEVTVAGAGTTTITASAPETDTYRSGSASYKLTVKQEGAWNLENTSYSAFLDDAANNYNDTNWSSVTVVDNYRSNSSTNRKDFPAPVTVSWTPTSGTESYTVSVYNDASLTDLEMSQTSTSTSTDIYNLIPGKTYYYTVTGGSSSVKSGTFITEGRRRMMKVSETYAYGHANNCRDFGGLMTDTGKTIRYNRIFRGSNMDKTSEAEQAYLTGYMNIGLDVDLRSGSAKSPGSSENGNSSAYAPFGTSNGIEHIVGNFTGNIPTDFPTTNQTTCTTMTNIFTKILETLRQDKAVYIHCYVGADRTGYVCILLEAVLGVSAKDCSIDYETTSFSCVGLRTRSGGGHSSGIDSYNLISGYSKGSTFKEKAYNILKDYGVSDEQITEFRNLMLE